MNVRSKLCEIFGKSRTPPYKVCQEIRRQEKPTNLRKPVQGELQARLWSYEVALAGILAVRKVTVATVFLNSGIRRLRCLHVVTFGCRTYSRCGISCTLREINGILSVERCPKRFGLCEESFQFGSIGGGSGRAI